MYSNDCSSCSFEYEIIKIGQSSHKLYSNNILNFQEFTTILDARKKKKVWKLIEGTTYYIVKILIIHIYIYICVCLCVCLCVWNILRQLYFFKTCFIKDNRQLESTICF